MRAERNTGEVKLQGELYSKEWWWLYKTQWYKRSETLQRQAMRCCAPCWEVVISRKKANILADKSKIFCFLSLDANLLLLGKLFLELGELSVKLGRLRSLSALGH